MDRLTPLNLQIPSGRSVPITYLNKKPPKIEVRIQEIFGWRDTPRILNGKLPIQLHLLGPNGRPQQITDDLGNFWATTYQSKPSRKKELTSEGRDHPAFLSMSFVSELMTVSKQCNFTTQFEVGLCVQMD